MSEKEISNPNEKLCCICNKNPSKYCCPKCEILYCSVECYKSENHLQCSEIFYKDCVTEELAANTAGDESKQKMIDILKRLQNDVTEPPDHIKDDNDDTEQLNDTEQLADLEELFESISKDEYFLDSDDEEVISLHERVKDLNLDDSDKLWNALTNDERNEFQALVSSGSIGTILPQWEPWWLYSKEIKLIEDLKKKEDLKEMEALKKCPPITNVPKLSSLTTVAPSSAVTYNITNVLASYVFVTRFLNGEKDPIEISCYLLDVCANLSQNANFENSTTAIKSVVQRAQQSNIITTDEQSLECMKYDVFRVLQGPSIENKYYYCKAALSHIHQVMADVKPIVKSPKSEDKTSKEKNSFSKKFVEHGVSYLPPLDIDKVKKCIKKVEYYLSFINDKETEVTQTI